MTEPTDAEIIALADETGTAEGGANGYILPISFARAVPAKWGTPPAVSGKPVAWWIPKAEQFCLADKSGDRPFAKAWEPLYATTQPTQAQAGAVPMTYDQVIAAWNAQADEYNQWDSIGEDEKIEWALKCADQFRGATKMMQVAQQALEALEAAVSDDRPYLRKSKSAIAALREHLEAAP